MAPIPRSVDLIVVEEAQLLSAGLFDFLARQKASIVFFSDVYQALQPGKAKLEHQQHTLSQRAHTLKLCESLRFGPSVASLCSALAHKSGNASREWVRGSGKSAVYDHKRRSVWEQQGQHYTVLAANHVTLFKEALEATIRGRVVTWLNGIESHPVALLRDLIVLSMGRDDGYRASTGHSPIETPSLRNTPSLGALLERYQQQPYHLISQLGQWICRQTSPGLLRIVDGWRKADAARQAHYQRQINVPLPRDLTLGTVQQAQGHEWPRVAVADDLFPMVLCDHNWHVAPDSQRVVNLAYTAISRAQRGVAVPAMFLAHLNAHGWDLPDNNPNIEIDPEVGEGTADRQWHTHFGMDRQARLELTPTARRSLQALPSGRALSTRQSGHERIREKLETDAEINHASGPADLRAALRRR